MRPLVDPFKKIAVTIMMECMRELRYESGCANITDSKDMTVVVAIYRRERESSSRRHGRPVLTDGQ